MTPWTVRDAAQHVAIIGAPGSGKTSGSGWALANAYVDPGRGNKGGVIAAVKPGEFAAWLKILRRNGRERDLIHVRPDGDVFIDLLDSEIHRSGRGANETENILRLIKVAVELGQDQKRQYGNDQYWEHVRDLAFRSAIHLSRLGLETVTFESLYKICISAPRSPDQAASKQFRANSYCLALIDSIDEDRLSEDDRFEFAATRDALESTLATMGEKPRGIVDSMVTSFFDRFLRGSLRKVFASGRTTHPWNLMRQGKIFIIDFPVRETGEVGVLVNGLSKYQAQREIERVEIGPEARSVFIWCDEYSQVAVDYDEQFLSTARSSRASMVMLFQNKPQLSVRLGGDGNRDKADSLLANAGTIFLHSNLDTVTNLWAADMIGKRLETFYGGSLDLGSVDTVGLLTGFGRRPHGSASFSKHYEYAVQPSYFHGLPTGGPRYGGRVGAVMVQGGRRFGTKRLPYLRVDFQQE
jgi:hypothetical protein